MVSILCWRSCCCFIPVVAFVPAVVSSHDIAVILNAACCWRYGCCLCHCCCWLPDCGRHSCSCWHPLSSWWFPVAGLSAIADVPGVINGVVGVSVVPFEPAVAGGPCCYCLPASDGVLAVATVPADPGVPILANGFTYWIVEWAYYTIGPSDHGCRTNFLCYQTSEISNNVLANSRNYRTIGYRIKDSIYRTIGLRKS